MDVSRETFERLLLFEALLARWNQRINLVGPLELKQLRERHVEDSLQLLPHLPSTGGIVDLGSGAGFPGLVVAIATGRDITLIEADQRKASFLREAARHVGVSATIIAGRIETCDVRNADIITARALAPLPRLLELAAPLLSPTGVCLFLKGANIQSELTDAECQWQMSATRHAGQTASDGCILEVRHLRRISPGSF
jgi:16S rRNA (guanine527-N7)-methyltransferase